MTLKRSALPQRTQPMPKGKGLRRSRPNMTAARKAAKGKPCLVRLPGCDGDSQTTCLAHYSLSGISGGGLKAPDSMGAWCCHHCHAIADGRMQRPEGYTRNDVRLALAEGVFRTQQAVNAANED